jgi:ParB-like chromosome segregation protein Spo0J
MPKRKAAEPKPDLSHIAEALRGLAVPCDSLTLDPANARKHPQKNLEAIRGSLRVYGQRKPVVVNRATGVVEAGNGTLAVARELGWSHVAAVQVDDDPMTAAGFAISDNRTSDLSEFDGDALASLLREVETGDEDLRKMLADLAADEKIVPPDEEPAGDQSGLLGDKFQVLIECATEREQGELLERLTAEGLTCRSLIS